MGLAGNVCVTWCDALGPSFIHWWVCHCSMLCCAVLQTCTVMGLSGAQQCMCMCMNMDMDRDMHGSCVSLPVLATVSHCHTMLSKIHIADGWTRQWVLPSSHQGLCVFCFKRVQ